MALMRRVVSYCACVAALRQRQRLIKKTFVGMGLIFLENEGEDKLLHKGNYSDSALFLS